MVLAIADGFVGQEVDFSPIPSHLPKMKGQVTQWDKRELKFWDRPLGKLGDEHGMERSLAFGGPSKETE